MAECEAAPCTNSSTKVVGKAVDSPPRTTIQAAGSAVRVRVKQAAQNLTFGFFPGDLFF
jgi:hypothetical protein